MLHVLQLQQEQEKESRRASQQQPHGSWLRGVKTLLYKATLDYLTLAAIVERTPPLGLMGSSWFSHQWLHADSSRTQQFTSGVFTVTHH